MKIKGNGEAQTEIERIRQQAKGNAGNARNDGATANATARTQEDTVQVTIAKDIAALATSRSERVAELRELIQSGKYNPDSRAIAGAIDSAISEEVVFDKIENI